MKLLEKSLEKVSPHPSLSSAQFREKEALLWLSSVLSSTDAEKIIYRCYSIDTRLVQAVRHICSRFIPAHVWALSPSPEPGEIEETLGDYSLKHHIILQEEIEREKGDKTRS